MKKYKYKKNLISGGILFAFGAGYYAMTYEIQQFKGLGSTPIDARFVPQMWGIMLMVLSAMVFIRGLREYITLKKAGKLPKGEGLNIKQWVMDNREIVMTFLALLIYIALLPTVGFVIMSALYIFAECMILTKKEKRKPIPALILGIVVAVVVDFIFVKLLFVLLPTGIIGW